MRRCLILGALFIGCTTVDETTGSDDSEVRLEQAPIETGLAELRAGAPYIPANDESPLAIGEGCIQGAKLQVAAGTAGSSAAFVQSREAMARELGFEISGTIPIIGGLLGSAGLTRKTTFDSQSAIILFQASAAYETVMRGANAVPRFDAANVSSCGYGYIDRAWHRLSSALVVKVRSTDQSTSTGANAKLGKTGIAAASLTVSKLVERGKIEIELHYATDVVADHPSPPFADSVLVIGTTAEEKALAMDKINRSLEWLAKAQTSFEKHVTTLAEHPETALAAPAQKVHFTYYKNVPTPIRRAIEPSVANAAASRLALSEASTIIGEWERFGASQREGHGFEWNVPGQPAGSIAELEAKRKELLEDGGGKLKSFEHDLEGSVEACTLALRNDDALDATALANALTTACKPAPTLPVDKPAVGIRQITYASVTETTAKNSRCPAGYRLPIEAEGNLFGPWSRDRNGITQGLWMENVRCAHANRAWLLDGTPNRCAENDDKKGLQICINAQTGPTR